LRAGRIRSHQLAPCLTATIRAVRLAGAYECSVRVWVFRPGLNRDLRRAVVFGRRGVSSTHLSNRCVTDAMASDGRNWIRRRGLEPTKPLFHRRRFPI
jgi:hypothetical protein